MAASSTRTVPASMMPTVLAVGQPSRSPSAIRAPPPPVPSAVPTVLPTWSRAEVRPAAERAGEPGDAVSREAAGGAERAGEPGDAVSRKAAGGAERAGEPGDAVSREAAGG